jgi:hypothetical protein
MVLALSQELVTGFMSADEEPARVELSQPYLA